MNIIFNILSKDPRLERNWLTLARSLNINQADIEGIRKNGSFEPPLFSVLQYWISRRGFKATIKELVSALNKDGYLFCTGNYY